MTALLAACAGGGTHRLVADTPVKLGRPYAAGGKVYAPADDSRYDRTGLASWYGNREQGHATANGERFDRRRVSAAHPTLPMPSYVAVTRLDTGRTMLVRINDRGPYARDRILDLSEEAARQLGIDQAGTALVRVRRVTPDASQRDALRRGYPVMLASVAPTATPPRAGRMAISKAPALSPTAVAPPPDAEYPPEPAPSPYSASPIVLRPAASEILVASPADPDAADALASALAPEGGHVVAAGGGYRVVTGPYPDEAARTAALARLRARGYQGAAALDAPTTNPPEATGNTLP
ncbi:MAG TPA: septal ring lytic transglycosylase RlpA family protein [Sphingomonas sp.]